MHPRLIHLINPKTDSLTTRPLYMNRALYSPLAGLLAVAAAIPRDRYEVRLTDENIEEIDFDFSCDLVGISAMTAYVNRGYEIADRFRARGVPVVMGGVHPSFMPKEALQHCDAVVIGEAELVIQKLLADLEDGRLHGTYRAEQLHPMAGLNMPRYDLLKKNRYVNTTFVQTSRGCHQGCTFCAEPLMNGLKFRYRPVDEVIREVETCGSRMISINDADFFGTPERPKEVMRALIGRGVQWQAGVTSKLAQDDRMLELAAKSGCTMLSIGFESISRNTLKSVHKHVNRPDQFAALVEKVHSYGIMVFGLFMFGFDTDDENVFKETAKFNIDADYDACAYSVLTPYPGTLTWYEMKKADRIVSFDWEKYDQANVVYRPASMTGEALRLGHISAYETFYAPSSIARRFPLFGKRSRFQWTIYNLFMKKGSATDRKDAIASPTAAPDMAPVPPILPIKREWRQSVLEAIGEQEPALMNGNDGGGGPARLGI
ncbi:MAG TPA: radical SAM protein [Aestuariivirgaceae bacterium]|nr:radical SAM protein [Aestuariivirgaceae bacterium]